jgi:hypothetical protein
MDAVLADAGLMAVIRAYLPATDAGLCWDEVDDEMLRVVARRHGMDRGIVRETYARLVSINMKAFDGSMGFYRMAGFINHSCNASARCEYDGSTLRLVAARDLEAGTEICINYIGLVTVGGNIGLDVYRELLSSVYGFLCVCPAHM